MKITTYLTSQNISFLQQLPRSLLMIIHKRVVLLIVQNVASNFSTVRLKMDFA